MSKMDTGSDVGGSAPGGFALSPQQARAWQWEGATGCRSQCALLVEGAVDPVALQAALDGLVAAHEILRTAFVRPTGLKLPLQVIDAAPAPRFDIADLSALTADAQHDAVQGAYRDALAGDALLQVRWMRLGETRGVLFVSASALCADGPGVLALGHALLAGVVDPTQAQDVPQYADIARWLESLLEPGEGDDGLAYWAQHRALQGEAVAVAANGAFCAQHVHRELTLDACLLDAAPGGTEAFLLACWQLLLQRRQRNDDVRAAVAFDGRSDEELAGVIGPLARYVPVRSAVDPAPTVAARAAVLASELAEAVEWQEYYTWPTTGGSDATYLPFAFSLVHAPSLPHVRVLAHSAWEERFELKLGSVIHAGGLLSELAFDPRRHAAADMARLLEQYHVLVADALARPQVPVAQLRHVGEAERAWLLSAPVEDYARTLGVPALFEQAVQARPNAVALRWTGGELTFADLDAQANRLANHLLSLGVRAESRVALCLDRGPEWIVALLGLLKAGAIYVPIDPEFHPQRIRHLLADAGCAVLLTDAAHEAVLGEATGTRVLLDRDADAIASCASTAPGVAIDADSLAYLIYTSGSTGTPKGVGVTHRNVHNYVRGVEQRLQLTDDAELLSLATIGADLGHTALLVALCTGRALRLLPAALALDADALARTLEANPTDCLKIVPTHLRALLTVERPERVLPRQCLVLGGAALEPDLVARVRALAPHCRIVNHYGPTETTVGVSTHAVHESEQPGVLPIGVALANSRFYVVDAEGELLGAGIPGELCIGGESLARGYWNQPGLTAERFLPDPFAGDGSRLYRTGDLAVMRADGEVVYLGRIDHQVKIRGYRVELGEVESVLREHAAIDEAVVVLAPGEKLNAYLVAAANEKIDTDTIRNWLRERLPDYMVPGAWLFLKALPLNRNGKVDRKQLPEITSRAGGDRPYRAPRTEVERQLAGLWQQVLGLEQVGIDDNFFDLGGDSIIAIQIAARLNRLGHAVPPKRIFEQQTIAVIADGLDDIVRVVHDHGPSRGRFAPIPSQARFFALHPDGLDQYNQAIFLHSRAPLQWAALQAAADAVQRQHDVLDSRFLRDADGAWWQDIAEAPARAALSMVDLSTLPADRREGERDRAARQVQASLSIERGPVARVVAFATGGEGEGTRLLWTLHHLVVDGVSWRILLEDINTAYAQQLAGGESDLGAKSAPMLAWSAAMARHADAAHARGETGFWTALLDTGEAPRATGPVTGPMTSHAFALDATLTQALLKDVPRAFNTGINDALLAALALAFARWDGTASLLVELEGHGREAIDATLEVGRTVGWFTSRYPVRLPAVAESAAPERVLAEVKECLRAIPDRGIGFGALRYASRDADVRAAMAALPVPAVSFNYLGQFGGESGNDDAPLAVVPVIAGGLHGAGARRAQPLAISASVADGALGIQVAHAGSIPAERASALGGLFVAALEELIARCATAKAGYTLSDFPGAALDQGGLDRLLADHAGRAPIAAIHPLSPLQHGMLFETMLRPGTGVNMLQLDIGIDGALDVAAMRAAWADMAARHPVLRTVFHGLDGESPRQVVLRDRGIDVREDDWRNLAADEQARRHEQQLEADRTGAIDLLDEVALRVRLVRLADGAWRMVWTRHHALVDGWSSSIVLRELMEAYAVRSAGGLPQLAPARTYGDYIAWLGERQRGTSAEGYWRDYLAGFERPTRIGTVADWHRSMSQDKAAEHEVALPAALGEALRTLARAEHVTVSCLFQAAWGVLLADLDGRDDVVFGTVVSGRPTDLEGVETIVGPLINTLPLRLRPDRHGDVGAWLRALQAGLLEHDLNSHLPLPKIQKASAIRSGEPLFASLLVVQNYVTDAQRKDIESDKQRVGVALSSAQTSYKISYPLTAFVTLGDTRSIRLCYDGAQFDAARMQAIGEHLQRILARLAERAIDPREVAETALAPTTAPRQALRFHHLGIACADIPAGIDFVRSQFHVEAVGERVHDPLQDAELCMIDTRGGPRIELVAGPQVAGLLARGITLYHTCYEVDDLEAAIVDMQARAATLVSAPKAAVLFGGRRVAFLQTPLGLVELLETTLDPSRVAATGPSRRLVVAGTFTVEPMKEALAHFAAWAGLDAGVEFAPYAQVFQQLVDAGSAMRTNADGANLLVVRLEDWFGSAPGVKPDRSVIEGNVAQFFAALTAAARGSAVPYVVLVAPASPRLAGDAELVAVCADFAERLWETARQLPAVHVVDGHAALDGFAISNWFDAESERIAHVPYTPDAFTALSVAAVRTWQGLARAPVKVIVLDCDNTLWGGVCAEVGPAGVDLSPARLELQRMLVRQHEAGVLLCLCSRNLEADALAVFDQRADMVLKREHLAAWRINWNHKSENIRDLVAELNLGLDSVVFLDDDDVQCAEVRANAPAVLTVQVPADDAAILPLVRNLWVLDARPATAETRQRNAMYRENRERELASAEAPGLAAFIASLGLDIRVAPIDDAVLERVAELTVRTNQFNLSGTRRTAAALDAALREGSLEGFCVHLADRFGDYGLVGALLFSIDGELARVDTLVLSCRALGRGVEYRMIRALAEQVAARGVTRIELPLVTTDRNEPLRDFLRDAFPSFADDAAAPAVYRVPMATAQALEWRIDDAAPAKAAGARPTVAAGPAPQRPPYEAIALALTDLPGVTADLRLAALPAGRNLRAYVAPRDAVEQRVCTLFADLLGVGRVGLPDHFFELGGHSLLATRLVAACQKEYGIDLPLARIFDAPTVEAFAATIKALAWARASANAADDESDMAMDEGAL